VIYLAEQFVSAVAWPEGRKSISAVPVGRKRGGSAGCCWLVSALHPEFGNQKYGHGYGHIYGEGSREIRATICEIRVEHKIALSMVSLSSTDGGRSSGPSPSHSSLYDPNPNSNPNSNPVRMQSSWKLILSQLRIVGKCHYDIAIFPLTLRPPRWFSVDDESLSFVLPYFWYNIYVRGSLQALPIAKHTSEVHPSGFPIRQIEIVAWFSRFLSDSICRQFVWH